MSSAGFLGQRFLISERASWSDFRVRIRLCLKKHGPIPPSPPLSVPVGARPCRGIDFELERTKIWDSILDDKLLRLQSIQNFHLNMADVN